MFSHVVSLNPLSGVNLQSLHSLYRPRQDSNSKSIIDPIGLVKNPSMCRTSSLGNNLTISQLPERKIKKAHSQPKVISSSSLQSDPSSSGKRPKFAHSDDLYTIIEENDQTVVQKKVKTERESVFFSFQSKSQEITSLIDEIDISLLERHNTDHFQSSSAFGVGFNYCGSSVSTVSTSVDRTLSSTSQMSSVSIESTWQNSYLTDAQNYISNITFGSIIDTLDQHCFTLPTDFPPMTQAQTNDYKTMENMMSNQKQLALQECLNGISDSDIQRLIPERYLNDSIINFYLK